MSENSYPDSADEISLFELLEVLKSEWKTWVGTTVFGAAIAGAVAFALPPKYEATAVVRVGQVGQLGQAKAESTPVESLPDAVERLKSTAFRRSVAQQLLGKDASVEALVAEMSLLNAAPPKVMKGTNLIEITVPGPTPEAARKTAELILENLQERHRPLLDQAVKQLQNRLDDINKNLALLDKGYVAASAPNPAQGGAFIQLAQLTESSRYATLRSQQLAIETALLPLNTKPTDVIEPISVSDRPVSPKKALRKR